jgi:hypothetical protein
MKLGRYLVTLRAHYGVAPEQMRARVYGALNKATEELRQYPDVSHVSFNLPMGAADEDVIDEGASAGLWGNGGQSSPNPARP